MSENILNLNYWYFVIFIYLFIGFLLSKGVIGSISRLMSVIGWPIELAQRLSGTKSLPYLFLFPNILIFGLFTFLPLFMNFGFSVKVSESENEEQWNDDGEWVSARFTTAADEVYEEWYYIVDGKLSWWGSAKRGLYTE